MKIPRLLKYTLFSFLGIIVLFILFVCYLYFSADMKQPQLSQDTIPRYELVRSDSLRRYGPNHLRHSQTGLWEQYLQGKDFERGVASGILTQDLLYFQEKVFVDQIREIIPSDSYLKFLRFSLILFNRNLGECVPEEYRNEIYGISLSCTREYDAIGTPYERQLNYHAAHDIGHAMQDYMLVGCSSFGAWGAQSADSSLIIGRNFDFYVGDDFALNKLVSFYSPAQGYRFASIGWAGMIGVLSGMNETGLTVTLNAAKSTMPVSAATPISILAREILQYASTIDEAYAIAQKYRTFVAESILVGSAKDGKAAIIEKATDKIALFYSDTNRIICTNHYQSETFREDERNMENIATSDSPYRQARLNELLDKALPVDVPKAASILRNRFGKEGKDIGLANEKAINQFIAHHSVIFKPEQRMIWVSTSPWQEGKYVAYDLKQIFANPKNTGELHTDSLTIPADTLLNSPVYQNLLTYRAIGKEIRKAIHDGTTLPESTLNRFLESNPEMYHAWELAGDYHAANQAPDKAVQYWQKALTKEIPKTGERTAIEKKIERQKQNSK